MFFLVHIIVKVASLVLVRDRIPLPQRCGTSGIWQAKTSREFTALGLPFQSGTFPLSSWELLDFSVKPSNRSMFVKFPASEVIKVHLEAFLRIKVLR